MIIEQHFLSICKNCPHLYATINRRDMYADNTIAYRIIDITCEKIDVCRRALDKREDNKKINAEG